MRLLFILPEYLPHSGGGIVTFYRHMLPEIVRQGHQVHVLVGSAFTSKLPSYEADGITVEFLDTDAVSANVDKFNRYHATPELQRHLAAAWTAWEQVDRGKNYDLVETTDWGLLFAPWVLEAETPPTVVQLHGSVGQIDFYDPQRGNELQGSLIRFLERELLCVADGLITHSQLNVKAWSLLTGREVTYIPPAWSPVSNLDLAEEKSSHGLAVGRIQYWKGPIVLCEALRLLGDSSPIIDWLGRDTAYQELGASMSAYLAQTYPDVWGVKIRPLGLRSPEETAKLQAAANFIVVPSIWDIFNYTCVEGMGCDQVVLCSQGAGAASLIDSKVNGLTFPANAPAALAESIRYFQGMSPDSRQQMGTLAQQTVRSTLDPKSVVKQRLEIYEKLIQQGKSPVRPDDWLVNATCPQKPLTQALAFLDSLPLKELSRYILHRSFKKFFR